MLVCPQSTECGHGLHIYTIFTVCVCVTLLHAYTHRGLRFIVSPEGLFVVCIEYNTEEISRRAQSLARNGHPATWRPRSICLTPSTAPACKLTGLKSAHVHACDLIEVISCAHAKGFNEFEFGTFMGRFQSVGAASMAVKGLTWLWKASVLTPRYLLFSAEGT